MNEEKSKLKKIKKALAIHQTEDTKYVLVEVTYHVDDAKVKVLYKDIREDVIDKFKQTAADYFMGDRSNDQ